MKKKIFVRAPCLSQSGYGEQSRFALRALRSREDLFEIYIQPIPWGQTGWIWQDNEFRRWMDKRITETQVLIQQQKLKIDISLQITIPNEFEKIAPINIGFTAGIETTKVAPQWLEKGNLMDKVLVVSNHARTSYENTVVPIKDNTGQLQSYYMQKPISVVWENTERIEPEPISGFDLDTDYNFLAVSQISPRKNFANTLKWFVEEFHDENVGLVLKTNMAGNSLIDLEMTERSLKNILSSYEGRKCKVILLHGDLSSGQMTWLYGHDKINSIINIAHGEGFGLPLFEAAREALPVVTIGWSGQVDFLNHNGKDYYTKVDYSLRPVQKESVWDGVIQADSMWAYADEKSYKNSLRKVYDNQEAAKNTAIELQEIINEKFNDEVLFKLFTSHFESPDNTVEDREFLEEMRDTIDVKNFKYLLLTKLNNHPDMKDKNKLLLDSFKNKECVILTCGPSLNDFSKEELEEKLQDKFVIAIKQAYNKCPDLVDMHIFNCNNYEPYSYKENTPIVVGCSSMPYHDTINNIWGPNTELNLFYQVVTPGYSHALCNTGAFGDYDLSKTLDRPWGPGVMSESVLYLVKHMGFKTVTTIGWDLEAPGETKSNHFYEDRDMINPAAPLIPDEAEKNIEASLGFYNWLKEQGTELYIGSDNSYVHPDVPRRKL